MEICRVRSPETFSGEHIAQISPPSSNDVELSKERIDPAKMGGVGCVWSLTKMTTNVIDCCDRRGLIDAMLSTESHVDGRVQELLMVSLSHSAILIQS